jgi:ankyrin repeat protein
MLPAWRAAAMTGNAAAIRDLLDRGNPIDARDRYGQTALMLAAHAGHLAAVGLLIEGGAELNHTAKYGLSALMLAVISRHEGVARALAVAGADLALRGTGAGFTGRTAADLAAAAGMTDLARSLRRGDPTEV